MNVGYAFVIRGSRLLIVISHSPFRSIVENLYGWTGVIYTWIGWFWKSSSKVGWIKKRRIWNGIFEMLVWNEFLCWNIILTWGMDEGECDFESFLLIFNFEIFRVWGINFALQGMTYLTGVLKGKLVYFDMKKVC